MECGSDDTNVEWDLSKIMDFTTFMAEMRTKFSEHQSAYQINSCSKGLEFKFCFSRFADVEERSNFTSILSRPESSKEAEKKGKNMRKKREARRRKRNSENIENCLEKNHELLFDD